MTAAVQLRAARFPEQLEMVRSIFREYAESLAVDLAFQRFDEELARLPDIYSPPGGAVVLAWRNSVLFGCAAFKPFTNQICEMKRLYVRPGGRGIGTGTRLALEVCHMARSAGYRHIRLDTLPSMAAAHEVYLALGFKRIEAYVYNPLEGACYMELDLSILG